MSQDNNSNNNAITKVEQSIRMEIVELDDVALDTVSGGFASQDQLELEEGSNSSQCHCTNRLIC